MENGADKKRATLSVPEAGRILGIGKQLAYAAAHNGELPVIKIGRRLLVPRAALERLLEGGGQQDSAVDGNGRFNRERNVGEADGKR